MTNQPRRPFSVELRKMGFCKIPSARDCLIYRKQVSPNRIVDVQLWSDDHHRVSYALLTKSGGTHHFVLPTDFLTIQEMRAAIQNQSTRIDPLPQYGKVPVMVVHIQTFQ